LFEVIFILPQAYRLSKTMSPRFFAGFVFAKNFPLLPAPGKT